MLRVVLGVVGVILGCMGNMPILEERRGALSLPTISCAVVGIPFPKSQDPLQAP